MGVEAADSLWRRRRRTLCALSLLTLLTLLPALLMLALGEQKTFLLPEATGKKLLKKSGTVIDVSNSAQGYVFVKHKKSTKRLKFRLTRGSDVYTYDLNGDGEYEVFPLQMGSGGYKAQVFTQAKGTSYTTTSNLSFNVKLSDDLLPFLYPNQYVWYTGDSTAAAAAFEVCAGKTTDVEKANAVYDTLSRTMLYNQILALTVNNGAGYLPDVDSVWKKRTGICFDYAAVMACMLRVQGIPTQLVIGHADAAYHAWNNVWLNGEWVRYDPTGGATGTRVRAYTEERIY